MAKRPNPLKTLQLSIELLRHIPKRGTITATKLREQLAAAGFEREPRTIQRLLETLCTSDLHDIECDASTKPYRYRWKEAAKGLSLGGILRSYRGRMRRASRTLMHIRSFSYN